MTDEKRALLGDHEAAKRLTDAGVLIPCAWCGRTPSEDDLMGRWNEYILYHDCKKAGPMRIKGKKRFDVCLAWNTRAPILSSEEMEMLDEH